MEAGMIIFFLALSIIALSFLSIALYMFLRKIDDKDEKSESEGAAAFFGMCFIITMIVIASNGIDLVG